MEQEAARKVIRDALKGATSKKELNALIASTSDDIERRYMSEYAAVNMVFGMAKEEYESDEFYSSADEEARRN